MEPNKHALKLAGFMALAAMAIPQQGSGGRRYRKTPEEFAELEGRRDARKRERQAKKKNRRR